MNNYVGTSMAFGVHCGTRPLNEKVETAIVRGMQLKQIKNALRYGEFQAFLKENNIPYSQAHKNIRMVTVLTNRRGRFLYKFLADWNLSKLHEISRLPQDILEDLNSRRGYPTDELCRMSVNELRIAVQVILNNQRKRDFAKIEAKMKAAEDRT